jgi:hypothetical protein
MACPPPPSTLYLKTPIGCLGTSVTAEEGHSARLLLVPAFGLTAECNRSKEHSVPCPSSHKNRLCQSGPWGSAGRDSCLLLTLSSLGSHTQDWVWRTARTKCVNGQESYGIADLRVYVDGAGTHLTADFSALSGNKPLVLLRPVWTVFSASFTGSFLTYTVTIAQSSLPALAFCFSC